MEYSDLNCGWIGTRIIADDAEDSTIPICHFDEGEISKCFIFNPLGVIK